MVEQASSHCIRLELPSHTLPPFTHTNTYIISSHGQAVLIDPGFYNQASLENILEILKSNGSTLKAILLTHTHPDHQEGIGLLEQTYDIPVYAHPIEQSRVKAKNIQPLDSSFSLGNLRLEVLFTPGHSPGHISFYLPEDDVAIVGDVVAGYGSTWIGIPDGNYNDYFASLDSLSKLKLQSLAPGHGPLIHHPYEKLAEVKTHRRQRLEQVLSTLASGADLTTLCQKVYPELGPDMQDAARGSLLALLAYLKLQGKISNLGKNIEGPYQQN